MQMKSTNHVPQRALSALTALALSLSLCVVPTLAAEAADTAPAGSFVNTSGDAGKDAISLSAGRSFEAQVPVDMTLEEAEAAEVTWSLDYDDTKDYLDPDLFPNHTQGGDLADWVCTDETAPFFTDVVTTAEEIDGQVYLKVTFSNNVYFYNSRTGSADPSAPHSNGGAYMDVCGYYDLNALVDGTAVGSTELKVAPYDSFRTMAEVYTEIDDLEAFAAANTDLYVEQFSMGMSQGDNGLDALNMPYLIVAKNKAAVENWKDIKAQAESDPAALIAAIEDGTLGEYQVPVLYSNVHANETAATDGILNFAWMLVEAAAADGALSYDTLTGFTDAGADELAAQLAASNVAVPDLVAETATYLGYIKAPGASLSAPVDLETYYTVESKDLTVDELLEDVFFIIVPEENVEGRTYLTRTSSGGFDLNRDNSFQTQAETQNMTALIAAWNPVSFTEFHGRVQTFQCEPCDPPHEPNFEYDLLAEHLMTGGEALGIAAVANNDGYNSYVIPQRDYLTYTGNTTADGQAETYWADPWDDMSTSYTPQYAMLHGTVSYTVELPAYNDHTATAVAYGQLGQSDYVAENKASYLLAQTKILERGVTNANSNEYGLVGQWFCDAYDVEGAEADLFRPEYDGEDQNGNFYPECYIIPLDGENQSNLQAADEMLEYLTRNGVSLLIAKRDFTYDGEDYPAGTAVVSMYQAKRSVANGVLYKGTVITEWSVLYSEGITAFDKVRGFDMIVCAEPAAYDDIAAVCTEKDTWDVSSVVLGKAADYVIITNASEDSTAAVNELLGSKKEVWLITEGDHQGSFLCSYKNYKRVADEYLLTAVAVDNDDIPAVMELTSAPVVYILGKPLDNTSGFVNSTLVSGAAAYNYDRQAMRLLGFTVTENAAKADLIIGAAGPISSSEADAAAVDAIKDGTPYIGYGSSAASFAAKLFPSGDLVRKTVSRSSMDALAYVTYPTDSLITASYVAEGDDILYGYGAGYYDTIPEGAEVLVRLDGSKAPLEGFLCSTGENYDAFLDDSIQAIAYKGDGANEADLDVVLFANTLTNKFNQRDEFNFISNAAFVAVAEESDGPDTGSSGSSGSSGGTTPVGPVNPVDPAPSTDFVDVTEEDWFADAVYYASAAGLMNGTSATTFAPGVTMNRAMLVTTLYRLAGSPAVTAAATFTDVAPGTWYTDAVSWAVATGVTTGTSATTFAPTAPVTREQIALFLCRYAQLQGKDVTAQAGVLAAYGDVDSVSTWAAEGMAWAVTGGLVTGKPGALLAPQDAATRAEVATILFRMATLA